MGRTAFILAMLLLVSCAACSQDSAALKGGAAKFRAFVKTRLARAIEELERPFAQGDIKSLNQHLMNMDLPDDTQGSIPAHIFILLDPEEKVIASRDFVPKGVDFRMNHPLGYDYSAYKLDGAHGGRSGHLLFCLYRIEGTLLVACRRAAHDGNHAGWVCLCAPQWLLGPDMRISREDFLSMRLD